MKEHEDNEEEFKRLGATVSRLEGLLERLVNEQKRERENFEMRIRILEDEANRLRDQNRGLTEDRERADMRAGAAEKYREFYDIEKEESKKKEAKWSEQLENLTETNKKLKGERNE